MNMKKKIKLSIVTLLLVLLSACGGGGGDNGDGISGTGITIGRITQFGSIYVNGVRFDVDNASFSRDGTTSNGQQDFSIGEYITIKGTINTTNKTGIANQVIFDDEVEGPVTQASTDNINIEVLGQKIHTDNATSFLGFSKLTDLLVDNIVEVSGIRDANGIINATSIKLKQTSFVNGVSENEIKGIVSSVNTTDKTFMLNSILVKYANASLEGFNGQPQNGQFVEAKSNVNIIGNTLIASEVELEDDTQDIDLNTEVEIEGIVTHFVSITDFEINGIKVTTDSNTLYEKGVASDVGLNILIEVYGSINGAGVLLARKIELEEFEDEYNSDDDSDSSNENDD